MACTLLSEENMIVRLLTFVVFGAVAGCATTSTPPRVDSREVMGRPVSEAVEVPVEVDGDRIAVAELACGGAFGTTLGPSRNVVHIRMRIRNLDAEPIHIANAGFTVGSDALPEPLANPVVFVGQQAQPSAVEIAPGDSQVLDVVFSLPASVGLEEVDGFELSWSTRVNGRDVPSHTTFAAEGQGDGQVARAFRPVI